MMSWQQCKSFNLLCYSDVIWRRRSQCLSYWLVAWHYNAISWTNTDLQSMGFCGKQQSGLLRSAHELITYHVLEIILQQITLYLPGASDLDIKACACCRRCHVCFPSSEFCRTPHIPVRSSVCGIWNEITAGHPHADKNVTANVVINSNLPILTLDDINFFAGKPKWMDIITWFPIVSVEGIVHRAFYSIMWSREPSSA